MILTKWLTQKIINIALANDKTEKKDFFFYCINTLLEQILFAVTILLFGLLTNKITSCVLFLLLFTGFRLTSGGYHASKQWICTILSYICAIGTLIVSPLVPTALMTTTMMEMKEVVDEAKKQGVKAKIIIGGAVVTESFAEEIGADGYSADAREAVKVVNRLLEK